MGFPIPIDEWFRGGGRLAPRLDLLIEPNSQIASCLDRSGVRRMVEEHRSGARNHCEDLWILLTLELWQRRFLASSAPHREAVRACALAS